MSVSTKEKSADCTQKAEAFCDVTVFLPKDFTLDSGESLSRPELRVRVYGDLEKPAVVVTGGISAGRKVADAKDGKGWWRDLVHSGGPIDLDKFCVIGFDFIPNVGETARTVSTTDHAKALVDALNVLDVKKVYAFVGASYGGMIGLAFAQHFPERVEKLCAISAPGRPHPSATALRGVQRRIIDFALKNNDPKAGVALARQLAMVTYRTAEEFGERFDSVAGEAAGDPYDVCEYLISRGNAYDMDAERYLTLSDSIDRHRVDPADVSVDSLIIAATSDRLAPIDDLRRLANGIAKSKFVEIDSLYGHDTFLKEVSVIGPHISSFLEEK